ncbi:MAG: hypothetical protein AAGJ81_12655, partial [Verrucomicrobiota bacterium]
PKEEHVRAQERSEKPRHTGQNFDNELSQNNHQTSPSPSKGDLCNGIRVNPLPTGVAFSKSDE